MWGWGTASPYFSLPITPSKPVDLCFMFPKKMKPSPIWARVFTHHAFAVVTVCIYTKEGGTLLECTSIIISRVRRGCSLKICDLGLLLYMTVFTIIVILWFCSALLSCYCMYICSNSLLLYFSFSIPPLHFTEKSFTSKRMGLFHTTWTENSDCSSKMSGIWTKLPKIQLVHITKVKDSFCCIAVCIRFTRFQPVLHTRHMKVGGLFTN